MKKWVSLLLAFVCAQQIYAADTANIKIKIAGNITHNTYFLCMPDLGCLSILAAKRGKIYPIMNNIEMNTLFVTNARNRRVYNQGLPDSCNVTVKKHQTITIHGTLNTHADQVKVDNLRCTIT